MHLASLIVAPLDVENHAGGRCLARVTMQDNQPKTRVSIQRRKYFDDEDEDDDDSDLM